LLCAASWSQVPGQSTIVEPQRGTSVFAITPVLQAGTEVPRFAGDDKWRLRPDYLFLSLVALDDSVLDVDHAVSVLGDVVLVGD